MTVTYTIEARDLRAFRAYARLKTLQGRRTRITTAILFLLIAVLFAMMAAVETFTQRLVYFLLTIGIFYLLSGVLSWIYIRVVEWKMLTPEKQRGLLGEHSITLENDAIIEHTSVDENKRNWEGVFKIIAHNDYIYIFLTPQLAHVIPRRAFSSPDLAESFFQKACELHSKAVSG